LFLSLISDALFWIIAAMTDLQDLLEKATEAVRRDLNHIFSAVSIEKLGATDARDLVAYVKLLSDLQDIQSKAAKNLPAMSEEALKGLAKQLVSE
jgi:NAD-dependent DNA ligase